MSNVETLNVGGKLFDVHKDTLRAFPHGFLRTLFAGVTNDDNSGRTWCAAANSRDADGRIYIDRDPATFAVALTYARTGRAIVPSTLDVERVRVDFDYYFEDDVALFTDAMLRCQRTVQFRVLLARVEGALAEYHNPEAAAAAVVDSNGGEQPAAKRAKQEISTLVFEHSCMVERYREIVVKVKVYKESLLFPWFYDMFIEEKYNFVDINALLQCHLEAHQVAVCALVNKIADLIIEVNLLYRN